MPAETARFIGLVRKMGWNVKSGTDFSRKLEGSHELWRDFTTGQELDSGASRGLHAEVLLRATNPHLVKLLDELLRIFRNYGIMVSIRGYEHGDKFVTHAQALGQSSRPVKDQIQVGTSAPQWLPREFTAHVQIIFQKHTQ